MLVHHVLPSPCRYNNVLKSAEAYIWLYTKQAVPKILSDWDGFNDSCHMYICVGAQPVGLESQATGNELT